MEIHMFKKIALVLAALALPLAGMAAPAIAGSPSSVTHRADDQGFNDPIKVQCTDGTNRWLGLGQASFNAGKCPYGGDVSYIVPAAGTQVRCTNVDGSTLYYAPGGLNYVGNYQFLDCVNTLL